MKNFRWNPDKNIFLKAESGVSFEEVVLAIEKDGIVDVIRHPNPEKYPNQRIFVIAIKNYAYLIPFVEETDCYFLKTIIPSRKATRDYLKKVPHEQ